MFVIWPFEAKLTLNGGSGIAEKEVRQVARQVYGFENERDMDIYG